MIDVENVPSELLLLSGSRLCMGRGTITGDALEFGQSMLRNPGGTGAILRLMLISVFSTTAQTITIGPTQNTYALSGVEAFSDGRIFGQGTVGKVLLESLLTIGSNFFHFQVNGADTVFFRPPVAFSIITPGTAFSVSTTNDVTQLDVSYFWVERVAQPSELNL